ncbi:MAG: DUF6273 domain-containing protein, partial [Oscillospiraceae bacterium]|nr:DUF6273 domain-containing protein [Oscillospiraceae bacterium]
FSCTWETSDIRKWLNGSFYSGAFSGGEKRGIAETTISNPYNAEWGTDGGNKTSDKVFLLSLDEAERYFSNDGDRAANYGNDGAWWWLRSPGAYVSGAAGVVGGGIVYDSGNYVFGYYGGVRPALYINL